MRRRAAELPEYFPLGTRYVVEGKNTAQGVLRVSARYVLFPDGRRVDLPLKVVAAPPLSPRDPLSLRARRGQPRRQEPPARSRRERARA
jgi:hypothetical protein